MRDCQARDCGHGVYLIDRPADWDTIDQATGTPLNQKWATISQRRRWRRDLVHAAKNIISLQE